MDFGGMMDAKDEPNLQGTSWVSLAFCRQNDRPLGVNINDDYLFHRDEQH